MSEKSQDPVTEFFADADDELLDWQTPWGKFRDLSDDHRIVIYSIYAELANFNNRQFDDVERLMLAIPQGMNYRDVFPTDEHTSAYLKSRKQ